MNKESQLRRKENKKENERSKNGTENIVAWEKRE
jgi:hypothetical protein